MTPDSIRPFRLSAGVQRGKSSISQSEAEEVDRPALTRLEGIPDRPVRPRLEDVEKRPGKTETLAVVAWKDVEQGQYLRTRGPIATNLVKQRHPLIDFGLRRGLLWKTTHCRELRNGVSH